MSQTIDLARILSSAPDSLIISTEGEDKAGKSVLELTAEAPLGIQDFDFGLKRALSGRPDLRPRLELPGTMYENYSIKMPSGLSRKKSDDIVALFTPVLDKFTEDFYKMVESPAVRTICWDTATEVWRLIRYVIGKRMDKIPYTLYPEMNAIYRGMLDAARSAGKHMVLTHKVKSMWENYTDPKDGTQKARRVDGKFERDGFDETNYAVDAYLRCRSEMVAPTPEKPDRVRFSVEFIKTGYNAKLLTGSVWENADWATITGLMIG